MAEVAHAEDAASRRRAVDPRRSVIVQAPAGSGKTSLLVERFLRLLAGVDEPEQVVAITFTRKAAAEMRDRVAAAIAACSTPHDVGTAAHERALRELAIAVRERSTARGWQLDRQPSRLRILTIDALNHWLARHQPVTARLGGEPQLVDDASPLYLEAARRTVAALEDDAGLAPALATLIRWLNGSTAGLVRQIATLLGRRELWLPRLLEARDSPALRAESELLIEAIVADELDSVRAALPRDLVGRLLATVAQALDAAPEGNPLEPLRGLSEAPAAVAASRAQWLALATLALTLDDTPRRALNRTQGYPVELRELKKEALGLIAGLGADEAAMLALMRVRDLPPAVYSDSEWQCVAALFQVLVHATLELQRICAARGRTDHAAVAAAARDALGDDEAPSDLALALDYRIQHLLVDEFQDTSSAQAGLLQRLVAEWREGDGRSLFCVGDPMQSIYGFREADVTLFLEARRRGLGGCPLENVTLHANFRSTPAVLDWINASFVRLLPRRDDFERGAIAYVPCVAVRPGAADDGVRIHALVDADQEIAAARVVEIVREALREVDGELRSVAILVRSRASLPPVLAALGRAGIACRGVDLETLADRMPIRDLLSLARALLHGGDRTAWLAVLRAPWCGLTLADLHAVASAARATVWEALNDPDLSERLSADGAARVESLRMAMEPVLHDRGRAPLGSWVQSAWLALEGPATVEDRADLDNARLCFAALDRLERETHEVPEASMLEAALARVQASPVGAADARVEIMTIHRAKGLEFDVVILPDLHRVGRRDRTALLEWQPVATSHGLRGVLLAPQRPTGGLDGADQAHDRTLHDWLRRLTAGRQRFELGRLAYVAATRARRQLHLIGNVTSCVGDDGAMKLRAPPEGSLLALLWPVVEPEFRTALAVATPHTGTVRQDPGHSRRGSPGLVRLGRRGVAPPAPPDVPRATLALRAVAMGVIRPAFDWASEIAGRVGTVLHAELHRICRGELALEELNLATRGRIWESELAASGIPLAAIPAAVARVRAGLEATRADPFGRRLLSRDWRHDASEMALSGVVEGRLVSVRIDRTCVDELGLRWIVDWKSSRHEGGDLEEFLCNELQRYAPQLRLYSHLLHEFDRRPQRIGLYFPLLGVWREFLPHDAIIPAGPRSGSLRSL